MVNHTEKTYIQISMAFSAGLKRWLLGPPRVFLKYKYFHITDATLCGTLCSPFPVMYSQYVHTY